MNVKNQISPAIINAAVAMLTPYIPDLTPTNLISALQGYEGTKVSLDDRPQKPYTVAEAMKLLSVSKPTIYRMFEDRTLRKIKVRGTTRIPAEDVNRLLTGNS